MADDVVKMAVPEAVVQSIVKESINAHVLAAMKGQEALVRGIVQAAIDRKVNENGEYARYESRENMSLLEYLCQKAIREAVVNAVKVYVEQSVPLIQREVEKVIKASTKPLVKSFVDSITDSAKDNWRLKIEVKPRE